MGFIRKEIVMRQHHFPPHMPPGNFQHYPRPPYPRYNPGPPPFPPGMSPRMQPRPGAGGFGGQKGNAKLDSILETANRFLATAQTFQPYIQQAAPMLRNLPALWKLYRGFQSVPTQGRENPQEHRGRETHFEPGSRRPERPETRNPEPVRDEYPMYNRSPRPSLPKIYQPPYDFNE